MIVRLNITIDEDVHERLKLPPKGISRFINAAIRARLWPSEAELGKAYRAAADERSQQAESREWEATDVEGWPE